MRAPLPRGRVMVRMPSARRRACCRACISGSPTSGALAIRTVVGSADDNSLRTCRQKQAFSNSKQCLKPNKLIECACVCRNTQVQGNKAQQPQAGRAGLTGPLAVALKLPAGKRRALHQTNFQLLYSLVCFSFCTVADTGLGKTD